MGEVQMQASVKDTTSEFQSNKNWKKSVKIQKYINKQDEKSDESHSIQSVSESNTIIRGERMYPLVANTPI